MHAGPPGSIKLSGLVNPSDNLLPKPEARDGEAKEKTNGDDGVGDTGAAMYAVARPEVIRDD